MNQQNTEQPQSEIANLTAPVPSEVLLSALSRDERSILLYCETCVVDGSGLLVGARMNADDMAALKKFQEAGLLEFGRVPYRLIERMVKADNSPYITHWVTFHEGAWQLAHALRRERAKKIGENRRAVNEALAERA